MVNEFLTPRRMRNRLEDLKSKLDFAIMFGDEKRIQYLNDQINIVEDQMKNREDVIKENL